MREMRCFVAVVSETGIAKGSSEMIAILGWVLFAVTILVAIWRDVYQQLQAEKRSAEDARYLLDKQKEWLSEKRNLVRRLRAIEKVMRDI